MAKTSFRSEADALAVVAARSNARLIGIDSVRHTHHARLVRRMIEAFGDAGATIWAEAVPPGLDLPRPDVILVHPDAGVLVVENKGVPLADITAVRGATLTLLRDGKLKTEDPFAQAERVMFRVKELVAKRAAADTLMFNRMVALPAIREADFRDKFGVDWGAATIFADCLDDARDLRIYVRAYVEDCRRKSGKGQGSKAALKEVVRVLTGTTSLVMGRRRVVESAAGGTVGREIAELDQGLQAYTPQQEEIRRQDVRGNHRLFRGVAGSGKTIMLAGQVARLVGRAQTELFDAGPPPRVLVVCFNRTLVSHLREKIEDELTQNFFEPAAPGQLGVMHLERLYRDLIAAEPTLKTPYDFNQPADRANATRAALAALPPARRAAVRFDAVFVDEAQDFAPEELMLFRDLAVKPNDAAETLVVFYDNAQNVYGRLTPVWEQLGIQIVGRTVFLDTCLRNTRQIVTLAFNVLLGTAAAAGAAAKNRMYSDVANLKTRGLVSESDAGYAVHFAARSGPPPVVRSFTDRPTEIAWVDGEIERLVKRENVRPSDVLVLFPSHWKFQTLMLRVGAWIGPDASVRMISKESRSEKDDLLVQADVLTMSTIKSAKGYDAPVVFVVGVDQLAPDAEGRASFYVAATRAKLRLYVTGVTATEPGLLPELLTAAERST